MPDRYAELATRALRDEPPSAEDARRILDGDGFALLPLLEAAFAPRDDADGAGCEPLLTFESGDS